MTGAALAKNSPAVIESTGTELAVTQADLPGLFEPTDADDRMVPSVYLMQGLSTLVADGIARPGDVILGLSASDMDPIWLVGGEERRESFDAYIIARSKSYARFEQGGGDMTWLDRAEFDAARLQRDPDVWPVYRYVIAVPEIDEILPARLMLTKTGGSIVARHLNTLIDRAISAGQTDPICVRFSVKEAVGKKSGKKYHAFNNPSLIAGTPAGLAVARKMMLSSLAIRDENTAPEVVDQPSF